MLTPWQAYEFVFQLYPTSNVFKAAHRVRLDVSHTNWPRFDVNPNTSGPLGLELCYQEAHQTIYHSPEYPSHVVLRVQP